MGRRHRAYRSPRLSKFDAEYQALTATTKLMAAGLLNELGDLLGVAIENGNHTDPAWQLGVRETLKTLDGLVVDICTLDEPPRRLRVPHRRLLGYAEKLAGVVKATNEFLGAVGGQDIDSVNTAADNIVAALRDANRAQVRLK